MTTLLLALCLTTAKGQPEKLALQQDSLDAIQVSLYRSRTDEDKLRHNARFLSTLSRTLKLEGSFEFPFDSLKEIGRLTSPDKKFRIYNWNIALTDGTHQYYGFIQVKEGNGYQVFELSDRSADNRNPENYTGDHTRWYGMLYYRIIPKIYKKKTWYTLLAWDGNDRLTSKKIIDILYFDPKGYPKFGETLFEAGKKTAKRVILEHSARASVSLKYHEQTGLIVFDHLAPPSNSLTGQFQFYIPDGSFDAFEFKKGKWVYKPDADARRSETPLDKPSHNNQDKGYKDPSGGTLKPGDPKKH